jgi:hypothetical protein
VEIEWCNLPDDTLTSSLSLSWMWTIAWRPLVRDCCRAGHSINSTDNFLSKLINFDLTLLSERKFYKSFISYQVELLSMSIFKQKSIPITHCSTACERGREARTNQLILQMSHITHIHNNNLKTCKILTSLFAVFCSQNINTQWRIEKIRRGGGGFTKGGDPQIAKYSRILGLKSWVLLTFDDKIRAKKGAGPPL